MNKISGKGRDEKGTGKGHGEEKGKGKGTGKGDVQQEASAVDAFETPFLSIWGFGDPTLSI